MANRLGAGPDIAILPGHSVSANGSDAAGSQPAADPTFQERIHDIVQRHAAIAVQLGALLVVRADDEDLQMIRENRNAFREHMLEQLYRLKDVQNSVLESLALSRSEIPHDQRPVPNLDQMFQMVTAGVWPDADDNIE